MPKALTAREVAGFREAGYLSPIPVLDPAETARLRARFDALLAAHAGEPWETVEHKVLRFKSHLLFTWLDGLIRHPAILDRVEDLIGPDILVWSSAFFVKPPRHPGFIRWHQDNYTYALDNDELVTAWVALSDATVANGCMRFLPGSHRRGALAHEDRAEAHNMASRGERLAEAVDERGAVDVTLKAGEMSLHHVLLVHASEPSRSDTPRIGYAIRYIPADTRPLGAPASVALVRGRDHGHFTLEPRPDADESPRARAAYAAAMALRTGRTFHDMPGSPRRVGPGSEG